MRTNGGTGRRPQRTAGDGSYVLAEKQVGDYFKDGDVVFMMAELYKFDAAGNMHTQESLELKRLPVTIITGFLGRY